MVGYCINLLNQEERFLETRNELSKIGIDLIRFGVDIELSPGIKKFNINPGDMCNSILNSHLKLYNHLKSINNKYHLIVEDDVIVLNNIDIENLIESAPNDWDVIYLGGVNHFFKPEVHSSKFYKCKYTFNPHAYIVKSSFLETLINRVEIRDFELDVIFAKMQSNEIGNWYCTTKDHLIQHGKYSDTTITAFGDDYLKIKNLGGRINLKELGPKIRRSLKQISKIEIFQDICKKQLKFIENKYPKIDKNSKLKSLIVESRSGDYIEFIIKNTIQKLGDGWGHIIVCTNENYNEIKRISSVISNEIEIINLGDFKITRNSYNNLCLDINFWNQINCEKVFVYQSDTYIFKEFDKEFLQPDYIGAPWGEHGIRMKEIYNLEKDILLGNGGLSLRTIEAIKWVLQNHKPVKNHEENMDYIFEDLYFSYHIEMSDKWKLADLELAKSFSFEHIFYEDTFGCHQPYCNSFHQDDIFERFLDKINGVNVLGFGNYVLGLGHNMRQIVSGLNEAKIICNINELKAGTKRIDYFQNDELNYFNTNLILCNPDYDFLRVVGDKYIEGKKNISLWAWELDTLPEKWINISSKFDEIWCQSEFCKNSFQNSLPAKEIKIVNIPGEFRKLNPKGESKIKLDLENKFVVTFIFDGNSDRIRKNPEGVINAFNKHLSKLEDCVLILKCHNLRDKDIQILSSLCSENKILINEPWSDEQMVDLISCTDIYTSLHRSEGSGLTIMESIYLGIPTITTNWSGNLDFCKPEFCELIDYELVGLSKESNYYKDNENSVWTEPSVDQAGQKMLDIYNDYDYYKSKTIKGKEFIDSKFNIDNISKFLKDNLV